MSAGDLMLPISRARAEVDEDARGEVRRGRLDRGSSEAGELDEGERSRRDSVTVIFVGWCE